MRMTTDQIFGVIVLTVAAGMMLLARGYTVGFYTDPLGARGLPFLAAALLAIGGVVLVVRRGDLQSGAQDSSAGVPWKRAVKATAGLLGYAAVLPIAGFITTTSTFVFLLGLIFGGPVKQNVILAIAYTAILYGLFAFVLGLSLPIGTLFLRSG